MLPFLSCWYHLCVQINPLIYSPLHPPLLISVGTFLLVLGAWKITPFEIWLSLLCHLAKRQCFFFSVSWSAGWSSSGLFTAWQFNCFLSKVLLMNSSAVDLSKKCHQSSSELAGGSLQKCMEFTWCFTAVQAMMQPLVDKSAKHHQAGLETCTSGMRGVRGLISEIRSWRDHIGKIWALSNSSEELTGLKLDVHSFLQYKSGKAHTSAPGAWSWKCEVR